MNTGLVIFFVILVASLIGGYFGYTKWWLPKQCGDRKEDKTLYIKDWKWDSGNCIANTCYSGYGTPANTTDKGDSSTCVKEGKTPPTPKGRSYRSTPGKCSGPNPVQTSRTTQQGCVDSCDSATTCYAYDYDSTQQCNLYDVQINQTTTKKDTTCYTLK